MCRLLKEAVLSLSSVSFNPNPRRAHNKKRTLSQGGDADETAQGGGVALDDEDTLNLDDAGFSRTDLLPGGAVDGVDVNQAEEEKGDEEDEVG